MIYDSLDTLPVKTFYKIQETGNFKLLNLDLENEEEAKTLFDQLSDEFNKIDKGDNYETEFMLNKTIAYIESKENLCTLGLEILRFELNQEVKEAIEKELHIKIRTKNTAYYYKDLERVESKIAILNSKKQKLIEQKKKANQKGNGDSIFSIDDALASISAILGVSFDFNALTCTPYLAYKKQTESKVKSQEKQLSNLKMN